MSRAHRLEACLDIWPVPLSRRMPIIRRAARSVSASPGEGCILAHIRVPQTDRAAAGVVLWCKGGEER